MHGAQSLRLASVIPDERGRQLSPNDDALVVEFHQLFIEPASQRIGRIRVRVGPTAVTPNDWMSEEAADLLRRFVACANPRTVPAHPLDLAAAERLRDRLPHEVGQP